MTREARAEAASEDFLDGLASLAFQAAKTHVGDERAVLERADGHPMIGAVELGDHAALVHLRLAAGGYVTVRVAYTGACSVVRRADEDLEDTLVLEQRCTCATTALMDRRTGARRGSACFCSCAAEVRS